MTDTPSNLKHFEDLCARLEGHVTGVLGDVFSELERIERNLLEREEDVREKEDLIEQFLCELEIFEEDLKATDTTERYVEPPTYDVDDQTYVVASELPDREKHVLATLQIMSKPDERGRNVVNASNKDIAAASSSTFDPVTPSAASACLTRITHKGLIEMNHLNGRGYPRQVVLKALLESPQEYIKKDVQDIRKHA